MRLVQVPVEEACKQPTDHPFNQPQHLKLAFAPPERTLATPHLEPRSPGPRRPEDRFACHKAVLRKMGFVLDYEAASMFSSSIEVAYSWGPPNYEMTQFVHNSGLVLAQISATEDSDFLVLLNHLAPHRGPGKSGETIAAESILKDLRAFCADTQALKTCYDEVNRPQTVVPSPLANTALAADFDVPPMQLPPHLLHRVRS